MSSAQSKLDALKYQLKGLETARDTKLKLISRLRQAYAIETGTAKKFELEYGIQEADEELAQMARKIEQIEQEIEQIEQKINNFTFKNQDESSGKLIDRKVVEPFTQIKYNNLRYFLEAGEWRAADEETLRVMLKATGREQQGWLRVEDFVKFPCQDLEIINQLWASYSAADFGFVVQREIWNTVNRSADKAHVIRDFCRVCGSTERRSGLIGWWNGDRILNLDEIYKRMNGITYPLKPNNIPKGLLPAIAHWSWLEDKKQQSCLAALFSRTEACNI
jgi:uncharacterized protein (UPF0335 family)